MPTPSNRNRIPHQVLLTREERADADKEARRQGLSFSAYVRTLILEAELRRLARIKEIVGRVSKLSHG